MASHIPATRITRVPVTARMEVMTRCEFESKESWLKTFPRITVSTILCQFFYIKNQSNEKDLT